MSAPAPLCPRCGLLMEESIEVGRFVCRACSVHAARPDVVEGSSFKFWIEEDDGTIVKIETAID